MKEELLNKFGEKLLLYAQNTETFLAEQTPEYIRQLLEFAMFENICTLTILISISLVLFLITILNGLVYIFNKRKDLSEVIKISLTCFVISFGISVFPLVIEGQIAIKEIYKIKYTPKVYIVEQIKKMTK